MVWDVSVCVCVCLSVCLNDVRHTITVLLFIGSDMLGCVPLSTFIA